MPTQAEVGRHQEAVSALAVLARSDLMQLLAGIDLEDARRVAAVVRDLFPELAEVYALAASTVAADWYDDLRAEAAAAGVFAAEVLDAPDADDLQDAIGDILAPLFIGEAPVLQDTVTRLDALADTLVTATDRQTVEANAAADGAGPLFARHASANACAFCAMLATRGASYTSEESASRVVMRRADRPLGEKYHDNCHCVAVPVWDRAAYEEAPYVTRWRGAYTDATKSLGGASNTTAILAHMRAALGTH